MTAAALERMKPAGSRRGKPLRADHTTRPPLSVPGEACLTGENAASVAHKPNHDHANSPDEKARNAQGCLRGLENRADGVPPGSGEGGEDQALNDEDEANGRQQVAHLGSPDQRAGTAAWGGTGRAGVVSPPVGEAKKRKNDVESGLMTSRVSFARRLDS